MLKVKKFKCDLNFSIQCRQESVMWDLPRFSRGDFSLYSIGAGQGIRTSFVPAVCLFPYKLGVYESVKRLC